MVTHSATLALDERIRTRWAAGEQVLHLGFGEAGLPVIPTITQVLAAAARDGNSYGPVAGSADARQAVAGYFSRRGLPTEPEQILLGPGSKALLFALQAAIPGDVVLPAPSWVSYAAHAALAGNAVISVPVPADTGGVPDPVVLAEQLSAARRAGRQPRLLVLTIPDNPTGTVPSAPTIRAVCEVAAQYELLVICDEIYRDLGCAPGQFSSPASVLPETTVITSGLSKSLALGGWRIGVVRLPAGDQGNRLRDDLIGVASEIWSSLSGPMQEVAAYAFAEPPEVLDHLAASRQLHQRVSQAVHGLLTSAGARCRTPSGGFYLYPDLDGFRAGLAGQGVTGSGSLAEMLLDRYGVGVLPGVAFGDDPTALRIRIATSLLYGVGDEQRWRALSSDDPVSLPWISASLTRLADVLADLTTDARSA